MRVKIRAMDAADFSEEDGKKQGEKMDENDEPVEGKEVRNDPNMKDDSTEAEGKLKQVKEEEEKAENAASQFQHEPAEHQQNQPGDETWKEEEWVEEWGEEKARSSTTRGPPRHLPGDWICGRCSNHVFARHGECPSCGSSWKQRKIQECRFYRTSTGCRNGDNCIFMHEKEGAGGWQTWVEKKQWADSDDRWYQEEDTRPRWQLVAAQRDNDQEEDENKGYQDEEEKEEKKKPESAPHQDKKGKEKTSDTDSETDSSSDEKAVNTKAAAGKIVKEKRPDSVGKKETPRKTDKEEGKKNPGTEYDEGEEMWQALWKKSSKILDEEMNLIKNRVAMRMRELFIAERNEFLERISKKKKKSWVDSDDEDDDKAPNEPKGSKTKAIESKRQESKRKKPKTAEDQDKGRTPAKRAKSRDEKQVKEKKKEEEDKDWKNHDDGVRPHPTFVEAFGFKKWSNVYKFEVTDAWKGWTCLLCPKGSKDQKWATNEHVGSEKHMAVVSKNIANGYVK